MKQIAVVFLLVLFSGCSYFGSLHVKKRQGERLEKVGFAALPKEFEKEKFDEVLELFQTNCKSAKTKRLYADLCKKAQSVDDAKRFLKENFDVYHLMDEEHNNTGLLTGYYSASLHGSYEQTQRYLYPIYGVPEDLVQVELGSVYPELKNYRLRGRVVGRKLIPYYERAQEEQINAPVICYCDSKIERFFLEVQGSGKIVFDDNSSVFVGYGDQNGHRYRSIGRYMIDKGYIPKEDISMQSIYKWLQSHPQSVDEVLNYNKSMVFFRVKNQDATGALGIELTPQRSVAVDTRFVPLGSMLYLEADLTQKNDKISHIVFAQDTGGAIKGKIRADLFCGSGKEAEEFAGALKAPLRLWIFLPKKKDGENE